MRVFGFILIIFWVVNLSYGQDWKTISGVILDEQSNNPVEGVKVMSPNGSSIVFSDEKGEFFISLSSNTDSLVLSKQGYKVSGISISSISTGRITLSPSPIPDSGKERHEIFGSASAISKLEEIQYNRGLINEPGILWQGKIAGLGVYKAGDNPNEFAHLRIRGLSTLEQNTEPLIIIDGLIAASIQSVDPNDIGKVTVLKDASATALYGIRGSNGVVIITTKKSERNSGVRVEYTANLALSETQRYMPVLTADEYMEAGGNDLGSETDWQQAVTRKAFSHTHHLAISGGTENTVYRASANLRSVDGILKTSEFDQINVRAGIDQYVLNDRLKGSFNLSLTERESDPAFNEAFRYAIVSDPTSPVKFDDGAFYQPIYFDNYNPVAILRESAIENNQQILNFNTQLDFDFTDELRITAHYGRQSSSVRNEEFYPSTLFFRGLGRNGVARRYAFEGQTQLFESYLTYSGELTDKISLTASAGYMYQEDEFEEVNLDVGNFPGDEEAFRELQFSGDLLGYDNGIFSPGITSTSSPTNKIAAFYGNVSLQAGSFTFNAGLRREGSSKLSQKNRWGLFPTLSASMDLLEYINLKGFDLLNFRAGYGVSGGLPVAYGLSQNRFEYYPETAFFNQLWRENPGLTHEKNKEFNLGFDVKKGKFNASVDVYSRSLEDLIVEELDREADVRLSYQNTGAIDSRGIELALGYENARLGQFFWSNYFVLNSYRILLADYPVDDQMIASPGAPGQGSTELVRLTIGEEIGRFWGPVYADEGADGFGFPIFKDLNNDGQLITNPGDALLENADFEEIGSGFPDIELGWSQTWNYKNWGLNLFFRGIFGHSKVNIFRMFYEPLNPGFINSYNGVKTEKAVEDVIFSYYSSLYVENAGFLSLDNATLSYHFDFSNPRSIQAIKIGITAQNLFILTNYTGISPEPTMPDPGPVTNGSFNYFSEISLLSPGIERRNTYFETRTILLSMQLSF